MNKAIITGSNGFIGSNLLKILSEQDYLIYAIIKDENENIELIANLPNVLIVYCEMSNIKQLATLITDRDIDICFHLAWAGSFGDARADYDLQLANVKWALDTVEVLAEMNVKRFVGAGTLAEKDVLNYHLISGAKPNAVSIYGIAKISTHFMTKTECTKLGIEHIWCYLSNTYGVGNRTNNFINIASKMMLSGKRAAFTSGEQMYDFVYITDTARAIFLAGTKGKINTAYYLGSTEPRKLREYIYIIRDTIDPSIELFLGEIPFNGKSLSSDEFNTNQLVEDTQFKPQVSFSEGIKRTVTWLKECEN